MLEKPALADARIADGLRASWEVHVDEIEFLPLGADPDTAVYRVVAAGGSSYFAKARRGVVDEIHVTLPRFLRDQGIPQVMAPLATRSGALLADVEDLSLMLYPFVRGQSARERAMSAEQWCELGTALARIHAQALPPALAAGMRRETYTATVRDTVRGFLARVDSEAVTEPVMIALATLLKERRDTVLELLRRADEGARVFRERAGARVVCHADLHAGNVLLGDDDTLYIVDWDGPVLAPKERDLMFIGGGQGFVGIDAREEEASFFAGYGPAEMDPVAITYYRCERILEDVAVTCTQLLTTTAGGSDRAQSLRYLADNFVAGGTIEIALGSRGDRISSSRA